MKRDRTLAVLIAALAMVALVIAVYLSVKSLTGQRVAGCGGDAACDAVLASPWSTVGPVPVSLLGALTYLTVIVGVALRWLTNRQSKLGDTLLLAAAPAMLFAAGWFIYLQLGVIGELCPFCMADHGIGLVLAILIGLTVLPRPALRPGLPIAMGIFAVAGLIAVQRLMPANDTQRTENFFADRDGDATTDDGKRHVSMFGGDLQFVLQDVPYLGDPQADQVVGLIFDYGCLYCRAMHKLLDDEIDRGSTRFVVVPLPVTIDEKKNPYAQSDKPMFDDSEERARLSLAVAAIDRAKWKQFDRWLFAMDESTSKFPRSTKDARAKAIELVGEEALNQQLAGQSLKQHNATIQRNIELLKHIDPPRYIPIVTTPGAPNHLTERFYDIAELEKLLDEAADQMESD